MNFNYELEIPANTAESSPEKLMMNLTFGILTKVYVIVPTGHAGLAHLKIMYHESQLYPLPPSTEYHGDGNEISFEDRQPIFINPYELKAIGWNTDDTYAHSFLMNFTITLPETLGIPAVAPDVLEIVRNIIGAELIIPIAKPPTIPVIPPLKQGLIIMSSPSYAKIFINDEEIVKLTKETVELPVGDYTIRLEKADYESWERLVSVKEGEFKEIRAELVKVPVVLPPVVPLPTEQGIYLTSSPSKANIFVDDEDTLKLTSEKLPLEVGSYKIRVEKEGYEDWEQDITVVEGVFKEVHAKMTKEAEYVPPAARQGMIIMSYPSYAKIFINNAPTGKLTKETYPWMVGDWTLKLTKEGYEDWYGDVTVYSDSFTEVMAYLVRKGVPPAYPPGPPPELPPTPPIAEPQTPEWTISGMTEHRIELDWFPSPTPSFDHFNLYRNDVLLVSTTESEYVDTDIEVGKEYCYQLSEVDMLDRESWKTPKACMTPQKYVIPEIPAGKSAMAIRGTPTGCAVTDTDGHHLGTTRTFPEWLFVILEPEKPYSFFITQYGFEDEYHWVRGPPEGEYTPVTYELKRIGKPT